MELQLPAEVAVLEGGEERVSSASDARRAVFRRSTAVTRRA